MMTKKPERSQSRSIGLVAIVNVGTAIAGILQAFVVGRLFGTTSGIEIYFAAVAFYQSMVSLMQTGQIAELFTPIYHELKVAKGAQTAFDLLSVLMNWMIVFAVIFSAMIFLAADYLIPVIVPGFEPDRMETCVLMFRWIIPLLSINIIQSLLSNLLAGEKQFVAQEVCRLMCLVLGILVIILLSSRYDAWVMIGALWVSNIIIILLFGYYLRRLGYRYSFRFAHTEFSVSTIFKNLPSIFGYVLATQLTSIAMTAGLSMLPQGSLAIFTYARRITSRINGILVRPMSVVFFNHFSSALADGDKAIAQLTKNALRISLVSATLACAVTVAVGFPGLKALWLSAKFPETAVFQTYLVVCVLCFLPVISGLGLIYRKINMSHQLFRQQYFLLTVLQIVAAVLAYCLIPILGLAGAVGVLIVYTLMMTAATGWLLRTRTPDAFCIYAPLDLVKCALILFAVAAPILVMQFRLHLFESLFEGRLGEFAAACIYGALSLIIVFVVAYVLKIEEVQAATRMVIRFLRPKRSAKSHN